MNETCEIFEAHLSALIDGELEVPEQLPAVDHLLECASCRAFYRRARALGDLVVSSESQDAEPASEDVWQRIAATSGVGDGASESPKPRLPRWTLQLAAVLMLGIGLGWLLPTVPMPLPSAPAGESATAEEPATGDEALVEVILEENRGTMTDQRFVEIATEVLRADRHYHHKMLEVMAVVTTVGQSEEGSVDERPYAVDRRGERFSLGESDSDNFVWSGDRL